MKHPLPDPALDDRLAFRGMTGSSRNLWCRHLRRAHPGEAQPRSGSGRACESISDGRSLALRHRHFRRPDLPITPQAGATHNGRLAQRESVPFTRERS